MMTSCGPPMFSPDEELLDHSPQRFGARGGLSLAIEGTGGASPSAFCRLSETSGLASDPDADSDDDTRQLEEPTTEASSPENAQTARHRRRSRIPSVVSFGDFGAAVGDDDELNGSAADPFTPSALLGDTHPAVPTSHAASRRQSTAALPPLGPGQRRMSNGLLLSPIVATANCCDGGGNNNASTDINEVSRNSRHSLAESEIDTDDCSPASLGRGRYGAVAQYHSPVLGRSVAVKTMSVFDSSTRAAAASELRFAHRALEHAARCPGTWAHIVRVFEAAHEETDGELSITMELMAGGPVAAHAAFRASASSPRSSCGVSPSTTPQAVGCASPLATTPSAASRDPSLPPRCNHTRRQSTVTLPDPGTVPDPATDLSPAERAAREARLRRVAADMLRGVATLHGDLRVIHRDITPANVLLAADGTAKLADFGVAAVLEPDEATATEQHGSLLYMAPERLRGDAYSFASDVWSVGVTLLQLALSGRHPFVDRAAEGASDRFWALAEVLRHTDSPAECARATGAARSAALAAAGLSAEFGSFIEATVAADPADRWSAAALLDRHPWLS